MNVSNENEASKRALLLNKNKGYSYISVDPEGMNFKISSFLDNTDTLLELWKSGSLCDVILYSKDNIPFKAHKLVLCSMSSFFWAAFIGAGTQMGKEMRNGQECLQLKEMSSEQLTILLNALYTKQLRITPQNLDDILSFSNMLGMFTIKDACCQFLKWTLGLHSCLQILIFADKYDCTELEEEVLDYLCSKFSELKCLNNWNTCVPKLSRKTVFQIFYRDDLACESEEEILEFGIEWVKGDLDERRKYLKNMIATLQLTPRKIKEVLERNNIKDDGDDISNLTKEINNDMTLHEIEDIKSEVAMAERKPQRHRPNEIYIMGGHDSSWRCIRDFEIYNPGLDEWRSGTTMPPECSFTEAVSARGDIFIIGTNKSLFQFDIIHNKWNECPKMTSSRLHCGVAAIGGTIYCCGGRTGIGSTLKTVEYYEIYKKTKDKVGKWVKAPPMNYSRCTHAACNLKNHVYVIGGQSSNEIYDTVEMFDAEKQEWLILSEPMRRTRKYLTVNPLNGRIYVIGGMDIMRNKLSEVETYDPREGKWKITSSLQKSRSSHASATFNGKIYVFGGNGDDDNTHSIVECYMPEKNQWIGDECAPMFYGRSGLSAIAI